MTEHTIKTGTGHRHEGTDANVRGVTFTAIGMAIGIALSLLIVLWTIKGLTYFEPEKEQGVFSNASQTPPEPRLQARPEDDLVRFRALEDKVLDSYGWVDKNNGIARIPVGRAMELMGNGKLPARGAAPVTTEPATGPPSGGPQTGVPVAKTPRPNPPVPQGVQH